MIANCKNGPLSANYDRKKNYKISQEKLYKILVIANCRNGLIFAFRDAAVVVFSFDRDRLIVYRETQGPLLKSNFSNLVYLINTSHSQKELKKLTKMIYMYELNELDKYLLSCSSSKSIKIGLKMLAQHYLWGYYFCNN